MRVPLNFNWPLNKIWGGYLNPFYKQCVKCPYCDGTHLNKETKQISDDFYGWTGNRWCDKITQDEVDALIANGRLHQFTHNFVNGKGWVKIEPQPFVSAEQVNELNKKPSFDGHDAVNRWILIETRAKRLGVYGNCQYCDEEGCIWPSSEIKAQYESWERTEPPTGDGFQLWETTSEGSPISPVFSTLDELCEYAANNCSTFGNFKTNADEWKKMLGDDFVVHKSGNMIFM